MNILKEFIHSVLQEKWISTVNSDEVYKNPSSAEWNDVTGGGDRHTVDGIIDAVTGDFYAWAGNTALHSDIIDIFDIPHPITLYIGVRNKGIRPSPSNRMGSILDPASLDKVVNNRHLKRLMGDFYAFKNYLDFKEYEKLLLQEKWVTKVKNEDVFVNPSAEEFGEITNMADGYNIRALIDRPTGDLYVWLGFSTWHSHAIQKMGLVNPITIYISRNQNMVTVSVTTDGDSKDLGLIDAITTNRHLKRLMRDGFRVSFG